MESELHDCVKEHRIKSRKVSKSLTKIQAKKLLKESQPDKAKIFCASDCWMHRFCKRKNTKIRKKSVKKKSVEDDLDAMNKMSIMK